MKRPEFTGERFIPGEGGAEIAYEHLHRYLFALRWASGKRVLDLAAGSGYGAALLSRVAEAVWAVELDEKTVSYAQSCYGSPSLLFLRSDARELPIHSASLDVVVALELLEHILEQERLIEEIARVLRPGGVALISTPNKAAYADARNYVNPYHVKELYRHEFLDLLRPRFGSVVLLTQQIRSGSLILACEGGGEGSEVFPDVAPSPGRHSTEPMYFLAVCSLGPSELLTDASAYMDPTDYLKQQWQEEIARLNREIELLGLWGRNLQEEIRKKDDALSRVLSEVGLRDETIRGLQEEMRKEILNRDESLRRLQAEFEDRTQWAKQLEDKVKDRDARLGHTQGELDRAAEHLARIRHAFLYRVLCRLGILPK